MSATSDALQVLVVDDERINCRTTLHQLESAGYGGGMAENAFLALEQLQARPWDVVLSDLRMPTMDGIEFLRRIKAEHPDVSVILMSAYGTVDTAVEAMQLGAADFLTKPFPFKALEVRLERLRELREARRELSALKARMGLEVRPGDMVGRSAPMQKVWQRIAVFARASSPVLVVGETGTGKELVARALHQQGPRARAPFIEVACGAIPRELAESELLGHEKGAFTGAAERRRGCFERADGGTLLLDDIDDLPLELQAKLLRVLQERRFLRVGGTTEIHVDVRVVATTKVDLSRPEVRAGCFRDDLFYRLTGLRIGLPPLRERGEDILLLATHFLSVLADDAEPRRLTAEAADLLRHHSWPGNVRELRRTMESAMVLCSGPEISRSCLPSHLRQPEQEASGLFTLRLDHLNTVGFQELTEQFQQALLDWALRKAGGNQKDAAASLGLARSTLQSKLAKRRK